MTSQPKTYAALAGRRMLVVEDEILVYMLIESVLEEHGCKALPPAARVATAVDLAEKESFDAAILDVNVAGETVYPVADVLARRGIPFVFLTGYGESVLEEPYRGRPVVQKPFRDGVLLDVLSRCVGGGSGSSGD
jgi:CheY-like chemotaxis protein